jgi:RNA polymerase sigma factor (TIGR02999 family)
VATEQHLVAAVTAASASPSGVTSDSEDPHGPDVTLLLNDWASGEKSALDRLMPMLYPELHSLASAYLRRGGSPRTLQTTAVVNELFVKLLANRPRRLESRKHFFVLAARIMRAALVDHYRQSRAAKRGGDRQRVPLHDELAWVDANSAEIVAFDRALTELEAVDRQQAEVFELRFVLGCTADETAELTGISKTTVDRKVRMARGWFFQRLRASNPEPTTNIRTE